MLGCRALYHDGWKAVVFHPMPFVAYDGSDPDVPFDEEAWELYHVAEDFSETEDLAKSHPEKLAELIEMWWREAEQHQVLPVTNRPGRGGDRRYRRDRYEYRPGIGALPESVAPNLRNRGWRLAAELVVPDDGAAGVIACHGGTAGGWSAYVRSNRLYYAYNFLGVTLTTVSAEVELPPGPVVARITFTPTAPFSGDVDLYYDDLPVGQGHVPRTTFITLGLPGFTVGYQRGAAVTPAYEGRFAFTPGALVKVVIEADGRPYADPAAEDRAAAAIQ
jgi:arylsulfatase